MHCTRSFWVATTLTAMGACPVLAQTTAATPAAPPASIFSGLIFGSYNRQLPTSPSQLAGQADNQFALDRAYLNFRMPAGDRVSIRITTDIYQSTEATPNAYTIRAKYAYLQYDHPKSANGASILARIGILNNVVIDHVESFWPRYLSQSPVERAGYFSSADVGFAGQLTFPRKMGEVYGAIVNGPGYTSRERDRFKDIGVRLSLTPLANMTETPILQTFTITGWGYAGATSSAFVNGGAGQQGAVGDALDRSRGGVFVGLKDPRLVLGGEYSQRHEDGEQGANTTASPRIRTGVTGRLLSAFTVVRPLAFANPRGKSRWGAVARYDAVKPTSSATGYVSPTAPATSNAYHVLITGLFFDLSQKAQIALDYQESLASNNGTSLSPPIPSKTYFAHFIVNF